MYYGEIDPGNGVEVTGEVDESLVFPQNGEFQKLSSILVDGGDRFGVSSVTFDLQEELVWMGNQGGHVTSYYGNNLEKYTSFQVHPTQEIRSILTFDEIILIQSQTQLRGQIRRGLPCFNYTSETLQDMQCMMPTSSNTVLIGGQQMDLVEFDVTTNTELKSVFLSDVGCTLLRGQGLQGQGRWICAGEPSGNIHLLDLRTYEAEHSLEAHNGSLSDFDVHGNLMVTCGFSSRHGNLAVDRFVKVYDLRALRAMAPIQLSIDPFLLRFLPSFSSRIISVSPTGQMEILETQAVSQAEICLYQVTSNSSMCNAFDVSSSCHQMAFGDSTGQLHLFSSNPSAVFNSFSRDTEFPDPIPQFPFMAYTDELVSYSTIPLPIPEGPLMSDWPPHLLRPTYRAVPAIDPTVLNSMKMVGTIGYAPNPGTFRRNQVMYNLNASSSPLPWSPQSMGEDPYAETNCNEFRSQGGKMPMMQVSHQPIQSPILGMGGSKRGGKTKYGPRSLNSPGRVNIPKRYARLEWKKGILEEEALEGFNRTKFSGLEATQANAYCNAMLQVLFYIDGLRKGVLCHLCKKEACLSCELSFLFHMMGHRRNGLPCLASNFLRAFRLVPEASALGLILQESQSKQRSAFLRLIQNWNRFILHQVEMETKIEGVESDPVRKLFAMKQQNNSRCGKCGREEKKESVVLLSNLLYTPDATCGGKRCRFVEILQRSLCPEQTTPAWCEGCEKYQPTFQSRVPKALPTFLALNTCLDAPHDFQTWRHALEALLPQEKAIKPESPRHSPAPSFLKSCRYGRNCMRHDCKFWHEGRSNQGKPESVGKQSEFEVNPELTVKWLSPEIRVSIEENRRVRVLDMDNLEKPQAIPEDKIASGLASDYKIFAVVVFARDFELEEKNNIVALINVDPEYSERFGQPKGKSSWYLFNDFSVRESSLAEATSFNPKWKIPSVVYYRKAHLEPETYINDNDIPCPIGPEVFQSVPSTGKKLLYKPLEPEEVPKKGELVAMDAEFVTLGQEETELRSDGKLATVKPQQLTVARITCVRGQGPLEGTPFIDDYISTSEVVIDYLTKFSGIKPGDLDANFSSKNVTGLKTVYLKLRYLIDSGVKFVGHGLSNDFRVINLIVPSDQVIDTVNLFYLPNQRMISLRFLAWHFLGLQIQSEVHDSIEDARAALLLFRKYEELKRDGTLENELEKVYDAGKKACWKIPNGSP